LRRIRGLWCHSNGMEWMDGWMDGYIPALGASARLIDRVSNI
jgi:hypothetical protein